MPDFINRIIDSLLAGRTSAAKFLGPALPWLEFGAFIISVLFIFGIIYFVIRSQWLLMRVDEWIDFLGAGDLTRRRTLRGWRQILKRLRAEDAQNWKLAILEADKILAELLRLIGFKGETVHERLQKVTPEMLPNIEELYQVHALRDRIVQEPDFKITHEEASRIIRIYARAFRELGLID